MIGPWKGIEDGQPAFGGGVPSPNYSNHGLSSVLELVSLEKEVLKDLPSSLISANCLPLLKYEYV